jgi:cytochrome oxidase assembly protein ShyY1
MTDLRFARRPAWIAGHVLVVAVVALMVALGIWQLRRLDERRADNALVAARAALAPVAVGGEVDAGDEGDRVDALRFRAVEAAGDYVGEPSVLRATQDGAPGGRVFSVLDLGDEAVAVLRGFVAPAADGSLAAPAPPAGPVVVQGLAVPRARLEALSRRAVDDLEDAMGPLLPVVVQAAEADDPALVAVPPPDLGEGPHLSYAVQWFLFAGVVAVGYPLLLRRRAQESVGAGVDERVGS